MNTRLRMVLLALSIACAPAALHANVKDGVDAWTKGDYGAAIGQWRPFAIAGDPDAQFNLGQAYKLGRGVPMDLKQAEEWYAKAAAQGHLQAEDNLALILFQNGARERAIPLLERSAARGEARAQYVLGTALFNGDGVRKDWVRAYALMTRASAAGLGPASANLAQMDKYIPLEQRQAGLQLASRMDNAPAAVQAAPSPRPAIKPPEPVRTAAIPPSQPVAQPKPLPKPQPKPTTVPAPKAPDPVAAPKPKPAPVAVVAAPGGAWRVQLGAFAEDGRAKALWNALEGKLPYLKSMTPYLVKAGAVTRLQAGPLASRGDAEKLCARIAAAGQGCLPVSR